MKKPESKPYEPDGIQLFDEGMPHRPTYIKNPKSILNRSTIQHDDLFCIYFAISVLLVLTIIMLSIHASAIAKLQGQINDLQTAAVTTDTVSPTPESTIAPISAQAASYETRTFKITGFCICEKCCGKTDGITATGVHVEEGITCAADWDVLPPGSIVEIEGIGQRVVQDKGSSVKGDHIDVYFPTHEEALAWGVQYRTVKILEVG